jgi:hypothetical protein
VTDYDLRVLSLGAGTQSSALLMLAIRGELDDKYLPLDAAIFADTGDEPREVYDWLPVLRREAMRAGLALHVIEPSTRLGDAAMDLDHTKRKATIPAFIARRDGSVGMAPRQCTADYKVKAIRRKVRELLGGDALRGRKVQMLIGMSLDEVGRMKPADVAYIDHAWPLIDMGWRRQTSIDYVMRLGLGTPPRSACVYCPFRSDAEWRRIRDTDPDDWTRAVEVDEGIRESNRRSPAVGS